MALRRLAATTTQAGNGSLGRVFDHVGVAVSDLAASERFYRTVLSVLGIIVTSWSWFGTNFLGFGLHSYGRRDGAMMTLLTIDFGFLSIAGLGCLPLHLWKSFSPPALPTNTPPTQPLSPTTRAKPTPV